MGGRSSPTAEWLHEAEVLCDAKDASPYILSTVSIPNMESPC